MIYTGKLLWGRDLYHLFFAFILLRCFNLSGNNSMLSSHIYSGTVTILPSSTTQIQDRGPRDHLVQPITLQQRAKALSSFYVLQETRLKGIHLFVWQNLHSLSNAVSLSHVQDYRSIKDVKLSDVNARKPTNPAQKRKKKLERIHWTQPGPKKTRQCEIRGLKQRGPS